MKTIQKLGALIMDLDGNSIRQDGVPLTVKRALATCMARGSSQEPVRMIELAHKLMHTEGDELGLEDSDYEALLLNVRNDRGYTDIVRAPLLETLKAAETPLAPPDEPQADQSK